MAVICVRAGSLRWLNSLLTAARVIKRTDLGKSCDMATAEISAEQLNILALDASAAWQASVPSAEKAEILAQLQRLVALARIAVGKSPEVRVTITDQDASVLTRRPLPPAAFVVAKAS